MNVNIQTAPVVSEIDNPPDVTTYRVRIYKGPSTNSTLVKTVSFTAEQAQAVQPINLASYGLTAGTYSVAIIPSGANGNGAESAKSNYVAMQTRRTATARNVRPGRRLAEAQQEAGQPQHTSSRTAAQTEDDALRKRHRNRHLL